MYIWRLQGAGQRVGMVGALLLGLASLATAGYPPNQQNVVEEVSLQYSLGVVLGMLIGGSLPLIMLQFFHNGDNSPP